MDNGELRIVLVNYFDDDLYLVILSGAKNLKSLQDEIFPPHSAESAE